MKKETALGIVASVGLFLAMIIGDSKKGKVVLTERDIHQLSTLRSDVREMFEELLIKAKMLSPKAYIGEARRTTKYQNALYSLGRTKPGNKVTNARGCMSWHVHGRAVDIYGGLNADHYRALASWWKDKGGIWGHDVFPGDYGHFEYHPGLRIEDVCPDPDGKPLDL